jgi:hypothetical protein
MGTDDPHDHLLPGPRFGRGLARGAQHGLEISYWRCDGVQVTQPVRLWAGLVAFSLLVTICVAAWHDFPVRYADSVEYLAYARSLHVAGVYGATEAGPAADAVPGREPLYSLFVVGLAKLHPSWSRALKDCSPPASTCASGLVFLKYANAVLLALAATTAGAIAHAFSGSRLAAIVATIYVSFNFTMWRELKYVISDYLAVFLSAIVVLLLVVAIRRRTDTLAWISFGFVLALLALTNCDFICPWFANLWRS